jgi:hypothetical protein
MSHRRIGAVLAAALLSVGLSACATIVTGTSQNITVESEPAGATCKLTRASATVGAIAETPAMVRLDRSKDNVEVTCDKEGHQQASEILSASFTGTTIGNVLLGGLIGVAVDAASGANNRYPEYVLVVLNPTQFSTAAARDQHFAAVKERVKTRADASIAKVRQECAPNMAELCNTNVKKVEEARDLEYGKIEQKRVQAKVAGQS